MERGKMADPRRAYFGAFQEAAASVYGRNSSVRLPPGGGEEPAFLPPRGEGTQACFGIVVVGGVGGGGGVTVAAATAAVVVVVGVGACVCFIPSYIFSFSLMFLCVRFSFFFL